MEPLCRDDGSFGLSELNTMSQAVRTGEFRYEPRKTGNDKTRRHSLIDQRSPGLVPFVLS